MISSLSLSSVSSLHTGISDLSSILVSDSSTQLKSFKLTLLVVLPTVCSAINNPSPFINNFSSASYSLNDSCTPIAKNMASQTDSGNPPASTPSHGSLFSPNALVPVSSYLYPLAIPMPQPGVLGLPWFTGPNITRFVKGYANMCTDYWLTREDMIRCILWYCDDVVAQNICSLPEYKGGDWSELVEALKCEYKRGDEMQILYSIEYLERLKTLERTENDNLDLYCQQFQAILNKLISRDHLDKRTQSCWFLQGLPRMI